MDQPVTHFAVLVHICGMTYPLEFRAIQRRTVASSKDSATLIRITVRGPRGRKVARPCPRSSDPPGCSFEYLLHPQGEDHTLSLDPQQPRAGLLR